MFHGCMVTVIIAVITARLIALVLRAILSAIAAVGAEKTPPVFHFSPPLARLAPGVSFGLNSRKIVCTVGRHRTWIGITIMRFTRATTARTGYAR